MIIFRSSVSGETFCTNMREHNDHPSAYIREIRGSKIFIRV